MMVVKENYNHFIYENRCKILKKKIGNRTWQSFFKIIYYNEIGLILGMKDGFITENLSM